MTTALITGVGGQDGWYLSELLIAAGYEVHGIVRPGFSGQGTPGVVVHEVDVSQAGTTASLVSKLVPDELYNLAAISSVRQSWQQPELTERVNAGLVAELLGAVRSIQDAGGHVRFVQASSSEIFGSAEESPQTETTRLQPASPYGAAKAYAHQLVAIYRDAGVHASSCILYNHESPRRPVTFVSRKITHAVARISLGIQDAVELGNLDARRDWGWAPDYVDALHRAAMADEPGDYVIATGAAHSVREFVATAFARVGIADWEPYVRTAGELLRPGDAAEQVGDASKARMRLGWIPSMGFEAVVAAMIDADLERATASI